MQAIFGRSVCVGDALPSVSWQYDATQFGRGGKGTIHTDAGAARAEGLPEPVATGPQVAALLFRQLRMAFGSAWLEESECHLTFRRPVPVDAFVTAKGVVSDVKGHGVKVHVRCEVWVEDTHGTKLIVGDAACCLIGE